MYIRESKDNPFGFVLVFFWRICDIGIQAANVNFLSDRCSPMLKPFDTAFGLGRHG